jgi:uncharacterized radical SAM protein YgiQ
MESKTNHINSWLPTSAKEMKALGWEQADVIFFSGDAYVDHPSFGTAVIARWMEALGLKVVVIPQPNWRDDLRDFKKIGTPRLFFAVSAGNMDSMINHYTAHRRQRSDDAFTPGGKAGARPDYAVTVYTQILKKLYPDIPVLIGGIEASLRRLAHYDYWSDTLKPSVLIESGADLLVYGMGEKPIKEIVTRLKNGETFAQMRNIPQTAYILSVSETPDDSFARVQKLHAYEKAKADKRAYAENFRIFEEESNRDDAARIIEITGKRQVIVNPPYVKYTQDEIDAPYRLPYMRMPHPRYNGKETIPAYEMIRDSVNIHRGCFGACSFCTISAHQGKHILSRSEASIVNEIKQLVTTPGFRGTITDLGGPSANMFNMKGMNQELCSKCKRPSCIYPAVCKNLNASHAQLTALYKKVSDMEGVKHVYIGSGVRYDLLYNLAPQFQKEAKAYLKQLVEYHVSGRLKVAPEHNAPHVLKIMRKPSFELFHQLRNDFNAICHKAGINQQVIPYLISSHPGSEPADMAGLAIELKKIGYHPEQVQDFTPTPMTLATAMYYTGLDPYTMKPVKVSRSLDEKRMQQKFFFYYKPENKNDIRRELTRINRPDLIPVLLGKPHWQKNR